MRRKLWKVDWTMEWGKFNGQREPLGYEAKEQWLPSGEQWSWGGSAELSHLDNTSLYTTHPNPSKLGHHWYRLFLKSGIMLDQVAVFGRRKSGVGGKGLSCMSSAANSPRNFVVCVSNLKIMDLDCTPNCWISKKKKRDYFPWESEVIPKQDEKYISFHELVYRKLSNMEKIFINSPIGNTVNRFHGLLIRE